MISRFQVSKFRSIQDSETLELGQLTVLVGPNNEGKSNLLRAFATGIELLSSFRPGRFRVSGAAARLRGGVGGYIWQNDFPLQLQREHPNAKSAFEFEFTLDDEEVKTFKEVVKSSLNGSLKVRVLIGAGHEPELKIVKRGPGSTSLNSKVAQVCAFISDRVSVDYVPALRSSEHVESIISRDIRAQVAQLQEHDEVRAALDRIREIYAQAFEPYEAELLRSMQRFIPTASRVTLDFEHPFGRFSTAPHARLMLDDGVVTPLAAKGDGVQSLAMLAIKKAALDIDGRRSHVLALEEPEAHLHPGAVRALSEVIQELSDQHQVVVTTHSPILVNRVNIGQNILVMANRAKRARSLDEVRSTLGVAVPDNMISAEVVLLVEGPTDAGVVKHLLTMRSPELGQAFKDGRLAITQCDGAQNAPYQYRTWAEKMCQVHVLLDSDSEGIAARKKLVPDLCTETEVTLITNSRYIHAELEDLIDLEWIGPRIEDRFNVRLNEPFHADQEHRQRFSVDLKRSFLDSGQAWDGNVAQRVKSFVAHEVSSAKAPVNPALEGVLASLERGLKAKLGLERREVDHE